MEITETYDYQEYTKIQIFSLNKKQRIITKINHWYSISSNFIFEVFFDRSDVVFLSFSHNQ